MDTHPLPIASTALDDDRYAGCAALFRTLADGGRHAFSDLGDGSREAMLAELATLQARGMDLQFDATSARSAAFVALDASAIARALDRRRDQVAWRVRVAFELGSTNTELLRDVKARGDDTPCLLAAECQHAGRGRRGRDWASAPGASITVSFGYPIARGINRLDGVTLVCGLAVQRVVASLGVPARLKWPNDLLVAGRKLAGILVEVHATPRGAMLVIGVGLNVAFAAPRLTRSSALAAVSLSDAGSAPVDRNRLIAELALSLDAHLKIFAAEGFRAFVDAWQAVDACVDRPVRLESPPAAPIAGIARGVDESGALLLDVGGDRRRVVAGDVSLRMTSTGSGVA